MGQKTHPTGFRLGVTKDWFTLWIPKNKRDYANLIHEDLKIKEWIKKEFKNGAVSHVITKRMEERMFIDIYCARPGPVIGKKGQGIERIKNFVAQLTGLKKDNITVDVHEIQTPELDAQLVADTIASQMEKRVSHRFLMKKAIANALSKGAKGIKIQCKGRLGGIELARAEWTREGRLPLNTIRADIDYGFAVAKTKWGTNSVKVWIFKGEILRGGVVK